MNVANLNNNGGQSLQTIKIIIKFKKKVKKNLIAASSQQKFTFRTKSNDILLITRGNH